MSALRITTTPRGSDPIAALGEQVGRGERAAVARALNLLDDQRAAAGARRSALLSAIARPETNLDAHLIGLTGPPGAGKSTLISALIGAWRVQSLSVGVLAADPSSPLSGGALLGDRLRMAVAPGDDGVFIRSLASRGSFGGLAAELLPMAAVMLAAFDRVIVETVGVGQREVDVAFTVDTTCVAVQPGAGDSVQYLKAGLMEIPDLLVVTKEDLGPIAARTHRELAACVEARRVPVLATSALAEHGIAQLIAALDEHQRQLRDAGRLGPGRRQAQVTWLADRLVEEFGRYGLERLGGRAAFEAAQLNMDTPILARLDPIKDHLRSLLEAGSGSRSEPGLGGTAKPGSTSHSTSS